MRPVRQIIQATPAVEGVGRCAARSWIRDTADYDPFLLLDDFRNDNPADYAAGFPSAPCTAASRPSLTCSPATSRTPTAWGTTEPRRRRHPVDDGRPGHPAPGDAMATPAGACTASSCGRMSSRVLKMTARVIRHPREGHPRGHRGTTARSAGVSSAVEVLGGGDRSRRGRRSALRGHLGFRPAGANLRVDRTRHAFAYVFAGFGSFRDASAPRAHPPQEATDGSDRVEYSAAAARSISCSSKIGGDEVVVQAGDDGIQLPLS